MKLGVTSFNHHFIPKFYLKGFCRSDGTFDVYDKQYGKFKKSSQTPSTVFFEKGKNTIKFRGQPTDQIEKLYSELETEFAQLFKLIREGISSDTLFIADGVSLLKRYMAIQFWRLPLLDEYADQYIRSLSRIEVDHICTLIKPPIPTNNIIELIQSDPAFRHYFRCFILPLSTFELNNAIPNTMKWVILDVEDSIKWSNRLCCDAPFIFKSPESLMQFSGPFIFPLSSSKLLVAKPHSNTICSFDTVVSTKISILYFLQAKRYVATSNRVYLEKIIEFSESYSSAAGMLQLQREVLAYIE
ncbi:MAG: DUF4238 domain-containing protein [Sideroxyarcus sp.]|nr:DUF4238 domain-containing protein [Sideroxyarcus sp.]